MSRPYRHKRPSPGADLKWHDKAACKPEAILELGQVVDWEYQLSLFYSERDRGAERALRVMEAKRICWTLCVVREECLEFAREDECVEVTPEAVRIRKVELDPNVRARAVSARKNASKTS